MGERIDSNENPKQVLIARKRAELATWLAKPELELRDFFEDYWPRICQRHMLNSIYALQDLANAGEWPTAAWRKALEVWSNKRVKRAWRYAAPLVQKMPDTVFHKVCHEVSWWIKAASREIEHHPEILLNLCERALYVLLSQDSHLRIVRNGIEVYDPISSAINHHIGYITQALINYWFKQKPNDGDGLPAELHPLFTQLCDLQVDRYRHGRVLLARRLIELFRVDPHWTEQHLLPIFDWRNPREAKAAWEGFLGAARVQPPLMPALKPQFLACATHYDELGDRRQQYVQCLTFAALARVRGYSTKKIRNALELLPQEGLEVAAKTFYYALSSAANQREEYWKNRALPFWIEIWPKSSDKVTPSISKSLALVAIAAGREFPAALRELEYWLQPVVFPNHVLNQMYKACICQQFPAEALVLIKRIIGDPYSTPAKLGQCLDAMAQADPNLKRDPRYQTLDMVRRR